MEMYVCIRASAVYGASMVRYNKCGYQNESYTLRRLFDGDLVSWYRTGFKASPLPLSSTVAAPATKMKSRTGGGDYRGAALVDAAVSLASRRRQGRNRRRRGHCAHAGGTAPQEAPPPQTIPSVASGDASLAGLTPTPACSAFKVGREAERVTGPPLRR